jgi:hypothetical protein
VKPFEAGWTFAGPPPVSPNNTIPSAVGVPQQVRPVVASIGTPGHPHGLQGPPSLRELGAIARARRTRSAACPRAWPLIAPPLRRPSAAPLPPLLPQVYDNGLIATRVLGFCWPPPPLNSNCRANTGKPSSYNVLGTAVPKVGGLQRGRPPGQCQFI